MPRTTCMIRTLAVTALSIFACAGAAGMTGDEANRMQIASPVLAVGAPAEGLAVVSLDVASYASLRFVQHAMLTGFPLADQGTVDLEVERFEVFSSDAVLVLAGDGPERPMPRPEMVLLRGHVKDRPESMVFLGLSPSAMNGYVTVGGRTYILTSGRSGSKLPAVVYDLAAMPQDRLKMVSHPCGTDELPRPAGKGGIGGNPVRDDGGSSDATCRAVRVAIDTDYEYTNSVFSGNATNSAAYAVTLLGAISEIYMRDFAAGLEVSYLRVWTTNTDPYSTGTVEDRLGELRTHWNANMSSVGRNIAHLLTGVAAGAGGVAWVGVVCPGEYSYGSSGHLSGHFPYPLVNNNGQNWDLMVVAHEIGHNFNAPHTHGMTPPVDGCGSSPQDCSAANQGTIMSYCHVCAGGMNNILLQFHPRTINEVVLPYLNGPAAGCLQARTPVGIASQPVTQNVPIGGLARLSVVAAGGTPITYQWRKNGVALTDNARITGSATAELVISPVIQSDDASYSVKVTNVCRSVTSGTAKVFVVCYANCDASLTAPTLSANDFNCFLNSFAAGEAYANCDGSTTVPVLNANDFLCYLNAFATGCP